MNICCMEKFKAVYLHFICHPMTDNFLILEVHYKAHTEPLHIYLMAIHSDCSQQTLQSILNYNHSTNAFNIASLASA
mgnify:CR=1 FL=1